jgi:acyl-CoA thioesterase-1
MGSNRRVLSSPLSRIIADAVLVSLPTLSAAPARSAPPFAGAAAPAPLVLFLGTSLTAGHGVDPSEAYPALVQARIEASGLRFRVVNAGVSGETSAGARRRIDWLMRRKVAVLVVETGANDGLRAQDPEATRQNIQAIFDRARRQDPPPRLVLAGMQAPPNLGRDYATRFRAIYPELARANGADLIPFLLEGVAGVARLNQADGIHPNAGGHRVVAETVWKTLGPLLTAETRAGKETR